MIRRESSSSSKLRGHLLGRQNRNLVAPTVLHIEDDADMSEALKTRLEAYGVAVVRAFDGMEGYRAAFRYPIDAILLDYELPNGHGDYILRRLKENPVTDKLPVIVITGRRDGHLERRCLGMGAASFLTKPVRFEALHAELAKHIDILARPAAKPAPATVHSGPQ